MIQVSTFLVTQVSVFRLQGFPELMIIRGAKRSKRLFPRHCFKLQRQSVVQIASLEGTLLGSFGV